LEKSAKLWMLNRRTMGKLLGLRVKRIRPFQLFDLKKLRLQRIQVGKRFACVLQEFALDPSNSDFSKCTSAWVTKVITRLFAGRIAAV
jgi:hypothetical protein